MSDDGLTIEKLREMMRKFDHLMTHDEIAVSMLFLPDKAIGFTDDRGTVWAMGTALWHRLRKEADRAAAVAPTLVSPHTHLFGIPFVFVDEPGPASARVRDRIVRSMEAAVTVDDFLRRIMKRDGSNLP